jgi:hypothetical protein
MKYLLLLIFSGIVDGFSVNNNVVLLDQRTAVFSDTNNAKSFADLTGPWQLFVDDYLIDEKINVTRAYHPFEKYSGNPVLVADKPWEGRTSYVYGTVLPEEQEEGYRMWYQGWTGKEYTNLYATSSDGLTWIKPDLGIVDFNGSASNNIFLRRTKEDHLPQVIYTPWEKDPNRRYKLLNYDYGRTKPNHLVSGFWGAWSADGIHWTDAGKNPVLKDPGDVGNFVWDDHAKRYVGYPKVFAPVRGFNRRCVGVTATTDFERWPSAQLILVPDKTDDYWIDGGNQRTEFYGLTAFPYESAYIGFLWIFHITDGKNDGPIFCELVSSRDGINWTREKELNGKRQPILPTGPKDAWDAGMVFTTNHPLVEGNTIKMWYGGSSATHSARDDSSRSGIGMATLRKDGFASLNAGAQEGIVTTKKLKNVHGIFRVNANADDGWLKVELLGADGKILPGYSRNDCEPVKINGTDIRVTWKQHKKIPAAKGNIYIRFILKNASLYSFAAGDEVKLAEPDPPQNIFIDFDKSNSSPAKNMLYRLNGEAAIVVDSITSKKMSDVVRLQPASRKELAGTVEILHTTDLGPQFTLSASVKTANNKLTRLFSNHRGRGEFVTGELIFDFDPTGKEIPGLRFTVNGQSIQSESLKFDDGKYHYLAVTYNFGKVNLYLDGIEVGHGKIESGAARLTSSGNVNRHFEFPNAMTEVGVHLGSNLLVGGDMSGDFFNYKSKPITSTISSLSGYIDDILLERKILSISEIRKFYHKRFDFEK